MAVARRGRLGHGVKESQRIREEEAEKWQARLREARDEAAQVLETERQRMHARLQKVKEELGQSYSEGFEPLLRAAQDRFKMAASEARRLQDEVRRKEETAAEIPSGPDGEDEASLGSLLRPMV